MNQIHAKDWADDHWGWHTGMDGNTYDNEYGREDGKHCGDRGTGSNGNGCIPVCPNSKSAEG